jgi:hypothetical protein
VVAASASTQSIRTGSIQQAPLASIGIYSDEQQTSGRLSLEPGWFGGSISPILVVGVGDAKRGTPLAAPRKNSLRH